MKEDWELSADLREKWKAFQEVAKELGVQGYIVQHENQVGRFWYENGLNVSKVVEL